MRSTTSCCTPAENCQLYIRLPQPLRISGSYVLPGRRLPKSVLLSGPHSPLVTKFRRSQSGRKLPLASFHDRVALVTTRCAGFSPSPKMTFASLPRSAWPATYLPKEPFSAVLPVPNRSYALPAGGGMDGQGMPSVAGRVNLGFGTSAAGPIGCSGNELAKWSYRRP